MADARYLVYRERYIENAKAMGNAMREAGEHIEANSQLDLTPSQLIEHIADIGTMLAVAMYHAERMRAYGRLMGRDDIPEGEARALDGNR